MSGAADLTPYPGNPSLPKEVRDKILSTFRHTLNLFKEGKTEDCVIGCDFILKMDPRFAPARQLMEKARNPASAVDVASLESLVAATPTRQERVASADTDRLLVRAAESYNVRDFDAAIAAAEQVLAALPGNQDATQILSKARQKKDAGPQFEVARQRALAALEAQQPAEARAALEKMRSLDAEHPAVSLLERRLPVPAPAPEIGESTNPGFAAQTPGSMHSEAAAAGALDDLSLDSLSLDDESPASVPAPPDFGSASTGPLSPFGTESSGPTDLDAFAGPGGGAPDLWSPTADEGPSLGFDSPAAPAYVPDPQFAPAADTESWATPSPAEPDLPSPQQEIDSLLAQGDSAARGGNRQQAIEIWSRIFLIDINNSEAVGRIETARQEMAEGNKRVAESLRRGRETFESGDFSAAREAFLEVLALDETDATARSYLDRIEQELSRPSAGLDLARKSPQGDILSEEMADTADTDFGEGLPAAPARPSPSAESRPRRGIALDKRFVMALGGGLVLALAVGAYFLVKPGAPSDSPSAQAGGPSLEHATALFRDGKIPETVAELKRISPGHPDYSRAQKLLASLTRSPGTSEAVPDSETAPTGEAPPAAAGGASIEAAALRQEAEKALAEKRYIDALKSFNLAASAYSGDPTFAQAMGAATEKVNELTPAVKLYNDGEYETAIPILWRIVQADRTNQDARSYLLRAYYNQGVAQLQNGLFAKAVESFGEVLAVDPDDPDAPRHRKFAQRYLKGDLDLMGRIYVRHVQQKP